MYWEAIGSIGEVAGATAVVITLAYLAKQVKTARDGNAKAAVEGTYGKYNDVRRSLYENPELAALFLNGVDNPEEMSSRDAFRFMTLCETLFLNGEQFWILMDKQTRDERVRNSLKFLAYFVTTPGGKAFWSHPQSNNLTHEFRELIEALDFEGVDRLDMNSQD